MAEIEITLPTVQYGNVKIRATPEELGLASLADAYDVGIASAVYLNVFTQGFKKGATLDVAGRGESSRQVTEAQAQRYLDEGLGGVTEVQENQYDRKREVLSSAVEAETVTESAPWTEKVDAKPKPWETGAAAHSPVLSSEW